MRTEGALRDRMARAIYALRYNGDGCRSYADAAIKALGLTWEQATWIAANHDTAAALAAGTMVALDREMSGRAWSALRSAFTAKAAQWAAFDQYEKSAQYADRVPEDLYAVMLAAVSPPASGDGQGGKP